MKGKADLSVVSRLALLFKGLIPIISNGNIITRHDVQIAAIEGTLLFLFRLHIIDLIVVFLLPDLFFFFLFLFFNSLLYSEFIDAMRVSRFYLLIFMNHSLFSFSVLLDFKFDFLLCYTSSHFF